MVALAVTVALVSSLLVVLWLPLEVAIRFKVAYGVQWGSAWGCTGKLHGRPAVEFAGVESYLYAEGRKSLTAVDLVRLETGFDRSQVRVGRARQDPSIRRGGGNLSR
jgi:hypothetical protein